MFCRLEKLVLGDGSSVLDNIVTVEHVLGNDQHILSSESCTDMTNNCSKNLILEQEPAWKDVDDDDIMYV